MSYTNQLLLYIQTNRDCQSYKTLDVSKVLGDAVAMSVEKQWQVCTAPAELSNLGAVRTATAQPLEMLYNQSESWTCQTA